LDSTGSNWQLQSAMSLNDAGHIVGTGLFDPDGAGSLPAAERALLSTPVPEPTALVFSLLLAVLASRLQRGRSSALECT